MGMHEDDSPALISPDWPTPRGVNSCITTRVGGVSKAPFDTFNIADHVDDDPRHVQQNREQLYSAISDENTNTVNTNTINVQWLQQVHGTQVYSFDTAPLGDGGVTADGIYTSIPGNICAVMTADCLPVLLSHKAGRQVAALHCGWRSLVGGIIPKALDSMLGSPSDYMAYLGPAISQKHFEVGEDVLHAAQIAEKERVFAEPIAKSFLPHAQTQGKYFADIYRIARSELNGLGLEEVYGGGACTYSEEEKYYSYRRDGLCGRMASLIWIDK